MKKKILLVLLVINLIFVVVRIFNNYSKFITDRNNYFYKEKQEVEAFYFGKNFQLVNKLSIRNYKNLLLVDLDPKSFYYLRYKLLPVLVYRSDEIIFGKQERPAMFDAYLFTNYQEMNNFIIENASYKVIDMNVSGYFLTEKNVLH